MTVPQFANAIACAILDPSRRGSLADAVTLAIQESGFQINTNENGAIDYIAHPRYGLPRVHYQWEAMTVAYPTMNDRVLIMLTPTAIEAALQHERESICTPVLKD